MAIAKMAIAKRGGRSGLQPRAIGVELPVYEPLRISVPAREALERAGNRVEPSDSDGIGAPLYRVILSRPPAGLVFCCVNRGRGEPDAALRLAAEPAYPDERPEAASWAERGDWVPCPSCGASLVWYEAGYVAGYRVCSRRPYHHAQLGSDGRSAHAIADAT